MDDKSRTIRKWWSRLMAWIGQNEALWLILCGVALLRLPSLFEPNRYADEDIYLTIGQALRKGLVLYRDIYDNKTPLIYVLAAAGNVMRFRLILMIWSLVNVLVIWKLAKRLIGKSWAVILTTALFAVLTTIPLLEGEIANGEIFMIMPAAAGMLLFLNKKYFWSGFLWSIAILFKVPAAVEFAGLVLFLIFWQGIVDKRLGALLLGFGVPIAASLLYFWLVGGLGAYLSATLLLNFSYLSAWGDGGAIFAAGGLFSRSLILAAILLLLWLMRKRGGERFSLAAIWFATALFGSLLSGRPYPHYLIEVVGPGILVLGLAITEISVLKTLLTGVLVGLLVLAVVRYQFWYYKSLPYYQNFMSYIFGQKSKLDYYRFWGENIIANQAAAEFIRNNTLANDKIFVWGTEPAIYALAKRLPVGKYTVAYHIADFDALDEISELLVEERPKAIVVVKTEGRGYSQLAGLLAARYVLAKEVGSLLIYLRLD